MDALEQARAEIDTVDAQLAALFERRMARAVCAGHLLYVSSVCAPFLVLGIV